MKASGLLEAIGRYHDSQGAFALLRSCTGWARILDSCRTVSPQLQAASLGKADRDIRHSLGRLVGASCRMSTGRLATLGVAACGIGARNAVEHAPAACVFSLAQSQELCMRIWSGFDEYVTLSALSLPDSSPMLGNPVLLLGRAHLPRLKHRSASTTYLAMSPRGHHDRSHAQTIFKEHERKLPHVAWTSRDFPQPLDSTAFTGARSPPHQVQLMKLSPRKCNLEVESSPP